MSTAIAFGNKNGSGLKIGIVRAQWNKGIVDNLYLACYQALIDSGVQKKHIITVEVPGSFELAFAAKQLIKKFRVNAVVPIGVLIKGETTHDVYLAHAASAGIMQVGLETGTPVIFGVLTCQTEAQAIARARGDENYGYWWGKSAIEMALLTQQKTKRSARKK